MNRIISISLLLLLSTLMGQAQLLYKIEGKGLTKPSYILGTQHLAPVSFVDSIPGVHQALEASEQVYGELITAEMSAPEFMAQMQQASLLPEGQTLSSILSKDEYTRLNAYLAKHLGADLSNPALASSLGKMTPNALQLQLTMIMYLQRIKGFNPAQSFDAYFQTYATKKGRPTGALETTDFQIKALFAGKPMERQVELLMCMIDNPERTLSQADRLLKGYERQDLKAILDLMEERLGDTCDATEGELDQLIYMRNRMWVEKIPAIMQGASTFFAVGAGHLPGPKGVLHLLSELGYSITPVR